MNSDVEPTLPEWLAIVGALVVAVGTYVPWIVTAPGRDVVIRIYVSGMEWGIAGQDYLVLGMLGLGLAVAGWYRRERRGGYVVAATGAGVALLTGYYLVTTLSGGGVTLGAFVPSTGAFLTVAGGLLLVVAGWRHLATGAWAGGVERAEAHG